jgi:flagellar basal body-associated protein FliL
MIMLMQPQNPYDFIQNTPKKPKAPLSKNGRIFAVVGGMLALLMVVVIFMAILSSAGKAGRDSLLATAQKQAELIRVSKLGMDRARGTGAKNLAITVNLSLQSDQKTLLAAISKQGTKIGPKELALGKKASTDTILTNAEQSNKFDEVFIKTIQDQLTDYQKSLNTAYGNTSSKKLQDVLKQQYTHAGLLAKANTN